MWLMRSRNFGRGDTVWNECKLSYLWFFQKAMYWLKLTHTTLYYKPAILKEYDNPWRESHLGKRSTTPALNEFLHCLLPLRHDFEGVWKVALDIFHLEGISVADLVIRAPIVGILHHDDITAWTAQLNRITLTCQFPPNQAKG